MLQVSRTDSSKTIELASFREEAEQRVATITSNVRRKFIPSIVGQEITYSEKEKQALAFLSQETEPASDDSDYGFIFGEVGITAETAYQVAQVILYKADILRQVGPMIEHIRLKATNAISIAQDKESIDVIVAEFEEDISEI